MPDFDQIGGNAEQVLITKAVYDERCHVWSVAACAALSEL